MQIKFRGLIARKGYRLTNMLRLILLKKKETGYIKCKIYRFHGNHLSQTNAKRATHQSRKIMGTKSVTLSLPSHS